MMARQGLDCLRRGAFLLTAAAFAVAGGLVLPPAESPAAEGEPLAARQAAARALVQEALQREIYGPHEERRELLEEAAARDEVNRPARWQQGLVQSPTGDWVRPEDFRLDAKSQTLLTEYRTAREAAADTVAAQLALANWCAEHKLPQQERAHLWRVITLDPEHAEARRRLGFVQVDKEWLTAEDAAEQQAARAKYAEALAKYREPLQEILRDLTHRSTVRQQAGRKKLDEIADPEALPAIEEVLGPVGGNIAALAIEKIDQFDGQEASIALCRFALFAQQEPLRKLATDKLGRRDKNDYIPLLLDLLSRPLQSRFVAVAQRNGLTNYQHIVVREGRNRRDVMVFNRQFLSHIEAIPEKTDGGATPSLQDKRMIERAVADAQVREGLRDAVRLSADRELELLQANTAIARVNRQVMDVLSKTTNQQYLTPDAWWQWWLEESDRILNSKRTTYSQQYTSQIAWSAIKYRRTYSQPVLGTTSCFAAGTLVWTIDGTAPIESLKVGDLVLSKNIETGELCYKPVLETTVRPPSPLVTFKAGADTFLTSKGHLFWHSGSGWTQARRLKTGMMLHTAADPVRVSETGEAPRQPTYNLVVADFGAYFVGEGKVLSHDVTEEEPTDVMVPGLDGN